MTGKNSSRRCGRCGGPIQWRLVRPVGARVYCSEVCAILALADDVSRTGWMRAMRELDGASRSLLRRIRLWAARWRAAFAQWRLARRLDAGPRTEILPWVWVPPRPAAAGLILVLALAGITGAHAPTPRGTVPLPAVTPTPPLGGVGLILPPESLGPDSHPPEASVVTTPPPAPRMLPPTSAPPTRADDVTRGNPGIREVAFTFDGDDQANVAHEILDMLRTRDVRATVFLTGQFIRLFPDVVRRMQAEGHEIANHMDTHPRLTTYAQNRRQATLPGVTREFVIGELRRAEDSLRALTGQSMAPY